MRRTAVAVLALVISSTVAGCGGDSTDDYCDAVKGHREELSEVLGDGGQTALLKALPTFEDLADRAPQDLRDEWQQVVGVLQRLQKALDDAGVDPATYDPATPPAGLSQAQTDRIAAAASDLLDPATTAAFTGVDQQARDVCGTPLLV